MKRNFKSLREQARNLLFEDSWPEYSNSTWADGERAGTQFDGPEDSDPMEPPITPTPQMATQLSTDEPPVDDPEYVPLNSQELAKALAVLAQRLPDDVAEKTYDKFEKYVLDNEDVGVEVIDDAGMESPEEVVEEVVEEARRKIRAKLLQYLLKESYWGDIKLGKHYDDDDEDDLGDEGYYSTHVPPDESASFEDIADMIPGVSGASGAKQYVNRVLKKLQTLQKHFPEDLDPIKERALYAFTRASVNLDLFPQEDVEEIGWTNPKWADLDAFRIFQDEAFILPGHQSLLRDMGKKLRQEIKDSKIDKSVHEMIYNQSVGNSDPSPRKIGLKLQRKNPDMTMEERDEQVAKASALVDRLEKQYEDLGSLTPGLADRAIKAWESKSQSRQMEIAAKAWQEARNYQMEG